MKLLYFAFALIIAPPTFSQYYSDYPLISFNDAMTYGDRIKSIHIKGSDYHNINDKLKFDENGNLISRKDLIGKRFENFQYQLTEDYLEISVKNNDDKAKLLRREIHFFDQNDNIKTSLKFFRKDTIEIGWFYKDNQVFAITPIDSNTKITRVFEGLCLVESRKSFKKEIKGEVLQQCDSLGNVLLRKEYYYENGRRKEAKEWVGGIPCFDCKFTYDKRGNWTKSFIKTDDGYKLYSKRKILYHN
ncbi:hypothetical protein [Ekhidna sp.]